MTPDRRCGGVGGPGQWLVVGAMFVAVIVAFVVAVTW